MTIDYNYAGRSRVESLVPGRSKHSRQDLVLSPSRLMGKEIERFVETSFVIEGQSPKALDKEINEAPLRQMGRFRKIVHPHERSIYADVSGEFVVSRYRTRGERYPTIRGRNVNMFV